MDRRENTWVSCYIYTDVELNDVINKLVRSIVEELKERKEIESFFFIRYWEDGPHLRLRLKSNEDTSIYSIRSCIQDRVSDYFRSNKNTYRLEFNKYIRETDRYGGDDSMLLSENQFQQSSEYLLSTLSTNENWSYSIGIGEALKLHLILISSFFNGDKDEVLDFLNFYINNWLPHSVKKVDDQVTKTEIDKLFNFYEKSYNKQKETLKQIVDILLNDKYKDPDLIKWRAYSENLRADVFKLIEKDMMHKPSWINYGSSSSITIKNQILWPWLDSLIHMTNNRLGIHLRDEAFIGFLMKKSFDYQMKRANKFTNA